MKTRLKFRSMNLVLTTTLVSSDGMIVICGELCRWWCFLDINPVLNPVNSFVWRGMYLGSW
jgi:hypothetical protein